MTELAGTARDVTTPYRRLGTLTVDLAWLRGQLTSQINGLDWQAAANDVRAFVRPSELQSLDLWCTDLFLAQLQKLK